jgi:hypothetical protein
MTRDAAGPGAALRAFERDSALACLAIALIAGAASGWRLDVAAGVVAGGTLMALSYLSIKGSVEAAGRALASKGQEAGRRRAWRTALAAAKYIARYALLAVAAYGILTCFRLHPAGVLAGALSPFLGALGLLARMSRESSRADPPH